MTSANGDPNGQNARLLDDLAQCSLKTRKTWTYTTNTGLQTVYPQGVTVMSLTEDWTTAPLGATSQTAVTTCLATRLNAFGVTVPIFLAGAQVGGSTDGPTNYPYSEALWFAQIGLDFEPPRLLVDVWPSDQLTGSCVNTAQLEAAIKLRVCSSNSGACGARIHDTPTSNIHTDCTANSAGLYQCRVDQAPQNVIETRLGKNTWQVVYACTSCAPPP
jgi:hypothetical protein